MHTTVDTDIRRNKKELKDKITETSKQNISIGDVGIIYLNDK
jgi:hypothetical protein